MEKPSYLDKSKLPYSLLLDAQTGRAAAYTNTHRLIVEEASPALLAYAQANTARSKPFDKKLHALGVPEWRPLPAWATPDVQERLQLIWIARPTGEDPTEAWLAVPQR